MTKRELVAAMIFTVEMGIPQTDLASLSIEPRARILRQAAGVAVQAADILLEELERC